MPRGTFRMVSAVFGWCAIATPALADQIVQSDNISLASGSIAAGSVTSSVGTNLAFAGFDPSKGTLTGVSISLLNSSDAASASLGFTSTAAGAYFATYDGWGIDYAELGGMPAGIIAASTPPTIQSINCAPSSNPGSCTASSGAVTASDTKVGLSDPNLSFYESAFALTAGLGFGSGAVSARIFDPSTGSNNPAPAGTYTINTATMDATWTGTVQLTYTYTPSGTPAPEPASIILLGSALSIFFGVTAKSRTRKGAA